MPKRKKKEEEEKKEGRGAKYRGSHQPSKFASHMLIGGSRWLIFFSSLQGSLIFFSGSAKISPVFPSPTMTAASLAVCDTSICSSTKYELQHWMNFALLAP